MWEFPILILLVIFGARINSTYDSTLVVKKYFTINNTFLSKLIIGQSKVNSTAKNLKINRNKITLVGLIFYLLIIILLIFTCIMLFVCPPIESYPFVIDSRFLYIYAKTINQKLSVLSALILLSSEILFYFYNTHKIWTKKSKLKD